MKNKPQWALNRINGLLKEHTDLSDSSVWTLTNVIIDEFENSIRDAVKYRALQNAVKDLLK